MPVSFDFSASPFDCLSADEQRLVRDHVDVGYWREGATLLAPGDEPANLFVVIKGRVQQFEGEEWVASYGPDDCFDGRALVAGKASSRFVAQEEVLALLPPNRSKVIPALPRSLTAFTMSSTSHPSTVCFAAVRSSTTDTRRLIPFTSKTIANGSWLIKRSPSLSP